MVRVTGSQLWFKPNYVGHSVCWGPFMDLFSTTSPRCFDKFKRNFISALPDSSVNFGKPFAGFHKWGTTKWMVYSKSHLEVDENCGNYPMTQETPISFWRGQTWYESNLQRSPSPSPRLQGLQRQRSASAGSWEHTSPGAGSWLVNEWAYLLLFPTMLY